MALTLEELAADAPDIIGLIPQIEAAISGYNTRKKTIGSAMTLAAEILSAAAPLADKIEGQVETP